MGGMGGEGGMMGGMEQPIEERCPDAQAGTYLLVVFLTVDAYRQREFGASFSVSFDLAGNGISNATGLAINRDNDTIYVVQPEEGKGGVCIQREWQFRTQGHGKCKFGRSRWHLEFIRERLRRVESGESKSLPIE